MNILVTGGAGYIGSHILVELYADGHTAVVADNLSNSSPEALRRVENIVGHSIPFYEIDVCDRPRIDEIFAHHTIDAVIHCAGLKAVGESIEKPLAYYRNNLDSSLTLLESMREHRVTRLIFSSSATVYGTPSELPLKETSRTGLGITNPYGQTKHIIEQILRDVAASDPGFAVTILRYFNPVGAHISGTIGEDPRGIPNNLMPYVSQVAVGRRDQLTIHGNDYDTPDGTCLRDYIHVVDLARGHVAALHHTSPGCHIYNLGSGHGISVLDVVRAFEKASGRPIPYTIGPRRDGDIAANYADATKANRDLHWHAQKSLDDMCADAWRWQSQNPNGYQQPTDV